MVCAGLMLVSMPSLTQAIVNIERMRAASPEPGFTGQVDINANFQSGNTRRTRYGFGSRLQWYRNSTNRFLVINHDLGETGGNRDINKTFLHGRHVSTINNTWAWEGFAQWEQNEFTRLIYRALTGVGMRRTFKYKADITAVYLGVGGFYSTEMLDDNSFNNHIRANLYLIFKHAINPHVRIISTTYYQPAADAPGDFRFLQQAAVAITINKKLDLTLSINIEHNSQPPASVQATDTSIRTGIQYRF